MGGVGLMDGLIDRYRIKMKTNKWTNRIFLHLIDMAMVNAYLLHRIINKTYPKELKSQLPSFRKEVAAILCKHLREDITKKSVGRPRASPSPKVVKKSPKKTYLRTDDTRLDAFNHWLEWLHRSGKRQCKLPGCKSETQCTYSKCKINVCCTAAKNCFSLFHSK